MDHRIFGPPMQTWRAMPKGMFLKSLDFATKISSPRRGFSLVDYCRQRGISSAEPVSMELFSTYGVWAQEQLVPHLEQTEVTRLAGTGSAFEIGLGTGEKLTARRVVMATGLAYFAYLPEALRGLPAELVTHTSQNREYERFRGKDVIVVGAGQSALEAAVLLHESGARPQLLTRGDGASFATPPENRRRLRHRILHPLSVLGASRTGFFLQHVPQGFYFLPEAKKIELTRKLWGPWGSWWLAPRFEGKVPGIPHTDIVAATARDGRLTLRLRDQRTKTEREVVVDHVVAGTGYEPDLNVIPFLDPGLANRVRRIERAPNLSTHFESSVRGLYFVGAAAAFSFGPLLRFVAGTDFAANTVARHLARARATAAEASPTLAASP
jgi:cation diffusion facilitator CzcD-associated flavoprotein CzcO